MMAWARDVLKRRQLVGVVVSVLIHVALLAVLIRVEPAHTPLQKRGDALIVELPDVNEPASAGTPGPRADEPPAPAPAAPAAKAPAPTPPTPKAPPTPRAQPTPAAPPRPQVAAKPAPPAERREAPKAVATAPQPPVVTEKGDVPAEKPAPQAPQPPQPPQTASQAPSQTPPDAAPPAPSTPPAVASTPPGPVAMIPPSRPDIRTFMRRGGGGGGTGPGGAGGLGTGRGGIVGEPVPLDAKDSELADYLERIKRQIKQNWVYPCVKNRETSICEFKSTELVVEFGILKPGPVQYVEVRRSSPWGIYDDYAVNAIKLASPFPPVPAVLMARMGRGSTGAAITARFVYYYETGLTNVLR